MPEAPAATIVLGRRGLERDVVRYALQKAGLLTVDLVSLRGDDHAPVVAVLVDPSETDWSMALQMHARVIVVEDVEGDIGRSVDLLVRGADAVVGTDLEVHDLVDVIATVASGGLHIRPEEASEAIARLRLLPNARPDVPVLTPRELDILQSIDRGDAVKQTARRLGISEKTVQNIQSGLFRKLTARNRAQAIARAHEMDLITPAVREEAP
jgi:DNA-binding NarL/FixJ family response regulator